MDLDSYLSKLWIEVDRLFLILDVTLNWQSHDLTWSSCDHFDHHMTPSCDSHMTYCDTFFTTIILDVDECSAAKSPCHERANCHNEPGTFRCKIKFHLDSTHVSLPHSSHFDFIFRQFFVTFGYWPVKILRISFRHRDLFDLSWSILNSFLNTWYGHVFWDKKLMKLGTAKMDSEATASTYVLTLTNAQLECTNVIHLQPVKERGLHSWIMIHSLWIIIDYS